MKQCVKYTSYIIIMAYVLYICIITMIIIIIVIIVVSISKKYTTPQTKKLEFPWNSSRLPVKSYAHIPTAYVSEGKDEVENAHHRWLFHVIEAIGRP